MLGGCDQGKHNYGLSPTGDIGWSRVITVPVLLPVRDYYSTVLRSDHLPHTRARMALRRRLDGSRRQWCWETSCRPLQRPRRTSSNPVLDCTSGC
eukprot:COSAG01_NODE_28203_length_666_cov_10.474427_1_plen_94_part_10